MTCDACCNSTTLEAANTIVPVVHSDGPAFRKRLRTARVFRPTKRNFVLRIGLKLFVTCRDRSRCGAVCRGPSGLVGTTTFGQR
jgi:hypothetical protein